MTPDSLIWMVNFSMKILKFERKEIGKHPEKGDGEKYWKKIERDILGRIEELKE